MTSTKPTSEVTVSVVMPCYNHGRFLAESVASVLDQTHRKVELILVDDGSSDNSRDVARGLAADDDRIKLIFHRENQGASRSRNDGLQAATGEFICFCDADDLWRKDKLFLQLELLGKHERHDVVYSDADIIDETGAGTGRRFSEMFSPPSRPSGSLFHDLCQRNFINIQTVMLRRACLDGGIFFDEKIKWVEDWWYWVCLSRHHWFLYTRNALAKYRVHSRSTAVTQRRGNDENRYKVFRRILKTSPDLPGAVSSQIWYHMGCVLLKLGKKKLAKAHFRKALDKGFRDWRAAPYSLKALARLV